MSALNRSFESVITRHEDFCLVRVKGELDFASAESFGERLARLSDRTIVFDLSELSFIDSSGSAVSVGAKNRTTAAGNELVLTRPRPSIERLFTTIGLVGLIGSWRSEWGQPPRLPHGREVAEEGQEDAS